MLRDVGKGYYHGTGVYGRTRKVVVKFNEFGQPVTALPPATKTPITDHSHENSELLYYYDCLWDT